MNSFPGSTLPGVAAGSGTIDVGGFVGTADLFGLATPSSHSQIGRQPGLFSTVPVNYFAFHRTPPSELKAPTAVWRAGWFPGQSNLPRVISLLGKAGRFETSFQDCEPGYRTFGYWDGETPKVGDIIVKPRSGEGAYAYWAARDVQLTIWEVTEIDWAVFKGSDENRFWKGTMRNLLIHREGFTNTVLAQLWGNGFRSFVDELVRGKASPEGAE